MKETRMWPWLLSAILAGVAASWLLNVPTALAEQKKREYGCFTTERSKDGRPMVSQWQEGTGQRIQVTLSQRLSESAASGWKLVTADEGTYCMVRE